MSTAAKIIWKDSEGFNVMLKGFSGMLNGFSSILKGFNGIWKGGGWKDFDGV